MKRGYSHLIMLFSGLTALLGSLGYSLIVTNQALADKLSMSSTACQALNSALQPTTITAIAGAVVTCIGAFTTLVKQIQSRPHDNTSVPAVKVTNITNPPKLQ